MNHDSRSQQQADTASPFSRRHGKLRAWLAAMLAAPASALMAHPGHQQYVSLAPPEHPVHWLIEPDHALSWIALGVLLCTCHHIKKQRALSAPARITKQRTP